MLDEWILARLHLSKFLRCVHQRVKRAIEINQIVHLSQAIEKSFGGFLDDDYVNVAVLIRVAARGGTEQNDALRVILLEGADNFSRTGTSERVHRTTYK